MSSATDRLHAVIEPEINALGIDVEDVVLTGSGTHRALIVAVDKDGGVGVDDIADVSRELSKALDRTDTLGSSSYTLEVTSRGVDRPLIAPRHWRRNTGRLVTVDTNAGHRLSGRIQHSDDTGAELDINGTVQRIDYADISRAQIQVEMNRKGA